MHSWTNEWKKIIKIKQQLWWKNKPTKALSPGNASLSPLIWYNLLLIDLTHIYPAWRYSQHNTQRAINAEKQHSLCKTINTKRSSIYTHTHPKRRGKKPHQDFKSRKHMDDISRNCSIINFGGIAFFFIQRFKF